MELIELWEFRIDHFGTDHDRELCDFVRSIHHAKSGQLVMKVTVFFIIMTVQFWNNQISPFKPNWFR